MSADRDRIQIRSDDLFSEKVQDYLALQQNLRQNFENLDEQSRLTKVIFSSWFYLSIASGLGAFVAWAIMEPFLGSDLERYIPGQQNEHLMAHILLFPVVASGIGLFLGAAEGIMCRNFSRACLSSAVGLLVGFLGGLIAIFGACGIYSVASRAAASFQNRDERLSISALLINMVGRAAAWAIAALPAGLGQGIAQREKKVVINGLVGGVLGGLLGGFVFDPISLVFTSADGSAVVSRAVGLTIIGLFVGLFVGLVEGWTKTAWLLMRQGPLAGKQFILFRDTTVLGSSPRAEVYLFKDAAIEPAHAKIYNRGGRFEIEDCETPDGTYVNGAPIKRHWLRSGDQIVLGKTVLEFAVKDAK